jgi:hypothetical protein
MRLRGGWVCWFVWLVWVGFWLGQGNGFLALVWQSTYGVSCKLMVPGLACWPSRPWKLNMFL